MSAATPGVVTISCATADGGTLSATMTADPDTGTFAAEAIRCSGSPVTGQLCIGDVRGSHYFTVTAADVITDTQLAAAGITSCHQVISVSLALV